MQKPKTPIIFTNLFVLTFAAVVPTEAGLALAVSHETFPFAGAAVGAVVGHVLRGDSDKRDLLRVAVVVVQG